MFQSFWVWQVLALGIAAIPSISCRCGELLGLVPTSSLFRPYLGCMASFNPAAPLRATLKLPMTVAKPEALCRALNKGIDMDGRIGKCPFRPSYARIMQALFFT